MVYVFYMTEYLHFPLHLSLVKLQDLLSCRGDAVSSSLPQSRIFTLITSVQELSTDWAPASRNHRLRLFERQEGGHPVYGNHREGRDWFRGDSLINARLPLDGWERRGRMLCIIQEKPGGEWRRIDGAKQHMQTIPCAFENSDFIGGFIHHSVHGFQ